MWRRGFQRPPVPETFARLATLARTQLFCGVGGAVAHGGSARRRRPTLQLAHRRTCPLRACAAVPRTDQLVAAALEAGDNLAHQAALDAVRLDLRAATCDQRRASETARTVRARGRSRAMMYVRSDAMVAV